MSKSAAHQKMRKEHLPAIIAFCEDLGIEYTFVHGYEWHIRVGGIMDVFPTRNKYHLIKTGGRGTFSSYEELGAIFTEYVTTMQNSDNHV